jgi:hypothetical protein
MRSWIWQAPAVSELGNRYVVVPFENICDLGAVHVVLVQDLHERLVGLLALIVVRDFLE